jgi:hypothetical protein
MGNSKYGRAESSRKNGIMDIWIFLRRSDAEENLQGLRYGQRNHTQRNKDRADQTLRTVTLF